MVLPGDCVSDTGYRVFAADERESSMQAAAVVRQQRQIGARGRTRSGDIDKIAAALILKNWLELTFKP